MRRRIRSDGPALGCLLLVLGAVFVHGLPSDFSWGDHTAYYYRIVDTERVGIDARSYSVWAIGGKPFLAAWPGLAGYHAYLTVLWLVQLAVLYGVLRFLGAGTPLSAALVLAHGLGYPLRSVGLVSSPKVLWLLTFDALVVAMVRLQARPGAGRLAAVVALWALSTTAHRFGVIAAMPLFLGVALCWPNRRLWLSLAAAAGVAVVGMTALMLTSRSTGSVLWSFFSSHFTLTWPSDWAGPLGSVAKVFASSGLVGGIALLGAARWLRWRRPAVVFLVTFSLGVLAFAILFPSGEKAMFVLPVLHSMVLLAAMAGAEPWPAGRWKPAAVAAGAVATLLLLPALVRRHADVARLESPYHDYADGFFGLAPPPAGMRYARDLVAGLPPASVIHADWGVKPMLRHLVRTGEMPDGVYVAKETEPPGSRAGLTDYLAVCPWMRLPARIGRVRAIPDPALAARGILAARLTLDPR